MRHGIPIDLLRHGETFAGQRYCGATDTCLTPAGFADMEQAVTGQGPWQLIVSSPLRRCADFAKAMSARWGVPLQIDTRLRELDFGEWENRSATELMHCHEPQLRRFWENPWLYSPTNGESLLLMRQRVVAAWRDIVDLGIPTLVVTHGGPIRIILCHLYDHPMKRLLEIDVPLASLRRIRIPSRQRMS